jgi:hypothetical protein
MMEQVYLYLKATLYVVGPILFMAALFAAYKLCFFIMEWEPKSWKSHDNAAVAERKKPKMLTQDDVDEATISTTEGALDDDDEEPQGMPGRKREIFRYAVDGHAVDQVKLYKWINTHFVPRITKAYEWFALWRVLRDKKLFEEGQDKAQGFADQMNSWFPDAAVHCSAGEVNRFKRGYLGSTPHTLWEKGAFLRSKEEKQTTDGYNNLDKLCSTLEESFSWKALEP